MRRGIMIRPEDIVWRTYKGTAGDLQSLLIGDYNGIKFSMLFTDSSAFDWSYKRAKKRIIKAAMLLHATHWID